MSTAFVAQLRTSRPAIQLSEPGAGALALRVEAADLWETVRVIASPETVVADLKKRLVSELFAGRRNPVDFVLKLRGWEVLDEKESLAEAGMVDGTILLLAFRRRRPVR